MKTHNCQKTKLVYRQLEVGEIVPAETNVLRTGEGEDFDPGHPIQRLRDEFTVPDDGLLRWVVDQKLSDEWRAKQPIIRMDGSEFRLALSNEESHMFINHKGVSFYAADSHDMDPEKKPRKSWFPQERVKTSTGHVHYVWLGPINRPASDLEQQVTDRLFQVATPIEALEQISEVRRTVRAHSNS